jgi:hypothetical protein
MRARRGTLAVVAVIATVLIAPMPPASAACREGWTDPGSSVSRGFFWDVSAVDASSAWAAGVRYDRDNNERLLVARWNGTTWAKEALGFSPLFANMYAVEAIADDDVWAAGSYFDEEENRTELVMLHYDGITWSTVDAPLARSQRITDLVAFANDDVWAAGWFFAAGEYRAWVLHWDGAAWSVVDGLPDPDGEESLHGIAGTSADDLWVTGTSGGPGGSGAILFHRDAGGWSRAELPSLPGEPSLSDVTAVSPDRAFAVGHEGNGASALVLRWNGTTWRKMPVPDGASAFNSVDAATARDVVTVGNSAAGLGRSFRWNGTAWRRIALPDGTQGSLIEVEHASGAWFAAAARGTRTNVLHRCSSAG